MKFFICVNEKFFQMHFLDAFYIVPYFSPEMSSAKMPSAEMPIVLFLAEDSIS